jgi:hypothetical protein
MPDKPQVKPYEVHHCEGRYMEVGRPWTGTLEKSLCVTCDKRYACWKMKNEDQIPHPDIEEKTQVCVEIRNKDLEQDICWQVEEGVWRIVKEKDTP